MTTSIAVDSVVRRDESLLTQELDGEVLIAHLESGNFYSLGASAKRIWDLIDFPRSVQEICQALLQDYAVDSTTCERDVLAFLATLVEKGVIRLA
jgi:hypothetical protein